MKVVIPLAGKGTRLRPHTHVTPKPLLRVADKPVMSYILDDLRELGVNEAVFITGHLKEKVEAYVRAEYPEFQAHFVEQAEQNGTAGAVELAREFADEDLLIMFVDTLFDADLSLVRSLRAGRRRDHLGQGGRGLPALRRGGHGRAGLHAAHHREAERADLARREHRTLLHPRLEAAVPRGSITCCAPRRVARASST